MRAHRTVSLSIALLATAALAATSPPVATAADKAIWGPLTMPSGASAFPVYRDLGVDTYQVGLDFSITAPTQPADVSNPADPAYKWPSSIDTAIAEGTQSGIDVAVLVSNSPGWANGGGSSIDAPQAAAFANFMAAASKRYPAVRRWMVWGEPNRDDRFRPNAEDSPVGARAYAPILDAAYGALKAVDPNDIVVGGMTWTGGTVKPARFLEFMRLPNGRPPRLDEFGHNPFPFRFPDLSGTPVAGGWRDISDLDTFGDQLRETYGSGGCNGPRFWLSEFLVQSDHASNTFQFFVSREEQARWLTAGYKIANELDSVAGLGWLSLLDNGDAEPSERWGLLTSSGARKPAFDAYKSAPGRRACSSGAPSGSPSGGSPTATVRVRPNLLRPRARARQIGGAASGAKTAGGRIRVLVSGRMVVRTGLGCAGRVKIGTRLGGNRRMTRIGRMGANCRYSKRFSVSTRRLSRALRPRDRRLTFRIRARFQGNSRLRPALSPTSSVRVRR